MTARKPLGVTWESWIDKQVREARERGEFNDLPGTGKPLTGLDHPHDDLWWVKQWLQREDLRVTPPTIALKLEVEALPERLARLGRESDVRQVIEEVNAKIRAMNRTATSGPPSTLYRLDADKYVERWRAGQPTAPAPDAPDSSVEEDAPPASRKRSWWRRRRQQQQ